MLEKELDLEHILSKSYRLGLRFAISCLKVTIFIKSILDSYF